MQHWPLVTVYLTVKNYGAFLEDALNSVVAQSYQNIELFIVDDGSDDASLSIAKSFKENESRFAECKIVHHKDSVGLQKIANDVAKVASGRYLFRLDADDWLEPDAILVLVSKALIEDSQLVVGSYNYVDETGRLIAKQERKYEYEEALGDVPHGACSLIDRNIFLECGGYDEMLSAQDGWDLWFKFKSKGKISRTDQVIFNYRQHKSSMSRSRDHLIKNRNKVIERGDLSLLPKDLAIIVPIRLYESEDVFNYIETSKKLVLDLKTEFDSANIILSLDVSAEDYEKEYTDLGGCCVRRSGGVPQFGLPILKIFEDIQNKTDVSCSKVVIFIDPTRIKKSINSLRGAISLLTVSDLDAMFEGSLCRDLVLKRSGNGYRILNLGKFAGVPIDTEQVASAFGSTFLFKTKPLFECSSLADLSFGMVEIYD